MSKIYDFLRKSMICCEILMIFCKKSTAFGETQRFSMKNYDVFRGPWVPLLLGPWVPLLAEGSAIWGLEIGRKKGMIADDRQSRFAPVLRRFANVASLQATEGTQKSLRSSLQKNCKSRFAPVHRRNTMAHGRRQKFCLFLVGTRPRECQKPIPREK